MHTIYVHILAKVILVLFCKVLGWHFGKSCSLQIKTKKQRVSGTLLWKREVLLSLGKCELIFTRTHTHAWNFCRKLEEAINHTESTTKVETVKKRNSKYFALLEFKRLANNSFSRHKSNRKKYLNTIFCMHENIRKDKTLFEQDFLSQEKVLWCWLMR